ncbi:MAG TPA: hypothetical protein VH208_12850, partial [Myxococcaceae bacterium]|nr:hypothetical protein [Myxococcaceae bacterium]
LAIAGVAVAGLGLLPPRLRRAPAGKTASSPTLRWLAAGLESAALLLVGVLLGLCLAPSVPGGLAAGATPPPLLPAAAGGFALGAAAAELAVMATAFVLVGLPFRDKAWYRGRVVVPACCLIAVVSLYWSLSGLLS